MSAPIEQLVELLSAAAEYRKAESPEAATMAFTLLTMKAGAALGCSPAEVKEQLELMRAPTAEVRMGGGGRLRGTPKALERVVDELAAHLKLTPAGETP